MAEILCMKKYNYQCMPVTGILRRYNCHVNEFSYLLTTKYVSKILNVGSGGCPGNAGLWQEILACC